MIKLPRRDSAIYSLFPPLIGYMGLAAGVLSLIWSDITTIKGEYLVVLGGFAMWRYSWAVFNYIRAMIYSWIVYPQIRRRARELPDPVAFPDRIFFVIPSYREEPWVSIESFHSILSNMAELPMKATLVVATGSDLDDAVIHRVCDAHPSKHKVEVVLQRQKDGKRLAMGHALRAVARRYEGDPNSVCIFMDGDSYLEFDTLRKMIPVFTSRQRLGGVTTNEKAFIHTNSKLYKDWFGLKFGQRHILFQSHSLSNKVMTLTGRFSAFRTNIVVQEEFIKAVEFDAITHWRHGKFRFLMGDDKSSWFYLLKNNWEMLYLPDVLCYSLESRDAEFLQVSQSLSYRWNGNALRNNSRALALGWKTTGLFVWYNLLEQRMNMWTSLVGITGAIILAITKSFLYLPFYLCWVLFIRSIHMTMIAIVGHPVSFLTIPLMLYTQWAGSLTKIKAFYNLSDQNWSKGKSTQKVKTLIYVPTSIMANWIPTISYFSGATLFIGSLLLSYGVIRIPINWGVFSAEAGEHIVVKAGAYGVIPNDGKDDAKTLNQLFEWAKETPGTQIELPAGELTLDESLNIPSNISVFGQGVDKTLLISRLGGADVSAIQLAGSAEDNWVSIRSGIEEGTRQLWAKGLANLSAGDLVLIRIPNSPKFLKAIGSKVWNEKEPLLRQQLVEIESVDKSAGKLVLKDRMLFGTRVGEVAEVARIRPIQNVSLAGFTLQQEVPGAEIHRTDFVYENLFPEYLVDGISTQYVQNLKLKDLNIVNSGNNPLIFNYCYECSGSNLVVKNSWNKGAYGNGYIRFDRSFSSSLENVKVSGIRHLVFQWSSANNYIADSFMDVDINFNGGYTQDNIVTNTRFTLPDLHPWPDVYVIPNDASWAPPNGGGNQVNGVEVQ